jgi:hypothetical protein
MSKLINFYDSEKAIQEYADLFYSGNFTEAVRNLCTEGMKGDRSKEIETLKKWIEYLEGRSINNKLL